MGLFKIIFGNRSESQIEAADENSAKRKVKAKYNTDEFKIKEEAKVENNRKS